MFGKCGLRRTDVRDSQLNKLNKKLSKNKKYFQKTIDKSLFVWYNIIRKVKMTKKER